MVATTTRHLTQMLPAGATTSGAAASSLPRLRSSATGAMQPSGTAAPSLPNLTAAASGLHTDIYCANGFQSGDLLDALFTSTPAPTVATAVSRSGGYSLQCNPSANKKYTILPIARLTTGAMNTAFAHTGTLRYTFSVRVATLPGANVEIISGLNAAANGSAFIIKLDSSGNVTAVGSTTSATAGTLRAGIWYTIKVSCLPNGSSSVQVNSGTAQTFTAANTDQTYVLFGNNVNTATYDVYFDDYVVAKTAFASPFYRVSRLDPNGAGSVSQWTGAYTAVDEVPHNSDTDYLSDATAGHATTVALESASSAGILSGATINAVMTYAVVRDEGGASSLAVSLKSGATTDNTVAGDPGATYVMRGKLYEQDPSTGAAWTYAALDSLEVGVLNSASVAARCTALYAMVLWTPGVTALADPFTEPSDEQQVFDGLALPGSLIGAGDPDVYHDGSQWHLLFTSTTALGSGNTVYEATLPAGQNLDAAVGNWTVNTTPLITLPGGVNWDAIGIETPSYVKIGSNEYIFYSGFDSSGGLTGADDIRIGRLKKTAGVWGRNPTTPVLTATELWENSTQGFQRVFEPSVVYDSATATLHMYYAAGGGGTYSDVVLAHAVSTDEGATWTTKTKLNDPPSSSYAPSVRKFGQVWMLVQSLLQSTAPDGLYRAVSNTLSGTGSDFTNYIQVVSVLSHLGHLDHVTPPTLALSNAKRMAFFSGRDLDNTDQVPHLFRITLGLEETGTIASALPRLRSSAAGAQVQTGTSTASLPNLIASTTGVMQPSGTSTPALPNLIASATGTQTQTGTAAAALPQLTASATGVMQPTGTSAAALPHLQSAVAGAQTQTGTAVFSLPRLTPTAVGAMEPSGTATPALPGLTTTAAGGQEQLGTAGAGLPRFRAAATGVMQPTGTSGAALPHLLGAAAGIQTQAGSGASSLPQLTAAAGGTMPPSGTAAASLPRVGSAASGGQAQSGTASTTLPRASASATGAMQPSGTIAATLPRLAATANGEQIHTGTAADALPNLAASASGSSTAPGGISGTVAASLSGPVAAASGAQAVPGTGTACLPRLRADATGVLHPSGTAGATLPNLIAGASGGQAQAGTSVAALPNLTASAAATQTQAGTGAATLPGPTGTATGIVAQSGTAAAALPGLASSGTGGQLQTGISVAILPGLTATGTGGQIVLGYAATFLPGLACAASAAQRMTGSVAVALPGLAAVAEAIAGDPQVMFGGLASTLPHLSAAVVAANAWEYVELARIGAARRYLDRTGAARRYLDRTGAARRYLLR